MRSHEETLAVGNAVVTTYYNNLVMGIVKKNTKTCCLVEFRGIDGKTRRGWRDKDKIVGTPTKEEKTEARIVAKAAADAQWEKLYVHNGVIYYR